MKPLKKKYGHNLEKLWKDSKSNGIMDILGSVAAEFESDLKSVNAYYNDKYFKYFDFGRWASNYAGLPPLERFKNQTKIIIEKIKKYVFSGS